MQKVGGGARLEDPARKRQLVYLGRSVTLLVHARIGQECSGKSRVSCYQIMGAMTAIKTCARRQREVSTGEPLPGML